MLTLLYATLFAIILVYRWKYMRTLLADGNFKQDHLAMKNDHDDVALSDGCHYMVNRSKFEAYIKSAPSVAAAVIIPLHATCTVY